MATHLLLTRSRHEQVYVPLALFFLANAVTEAVSLIAAPQVISLYEFWPRVLAVSSLPMHLLLAPLFWLYVRALTADGHIVWRKQDSIHFLPAVVAIGVPLFAAYLGRGEFLALFDKSKLYNSDSQLTLIWSIKILESFVIAQVAYYIVIILRRLAEYKKSLVQLFASTEHLELKWVRWLATFLVIYIVVSAASSIIHKPFLFEPWESIIDLALLWFLVIWGLRQKPGLANEVAATKQANLQFTGKYEHSALSEEQLRSIADKVSNSMRQELLYRDHELSLRTLSAHINELPNYVSQALNQEIGESFFDYVNHWRIEDAKQKLSESALTVLSIAEEVGFNSRSSFYNAFKKSTGQTPSAFRKALSQT